MSIHRGTPLIMNSHHLVVYVGVVVNSFNTHIRVWQPELNHGEGFMDYDPYNTTFKLMDSKTEFDHSNMVILHWWDIMHPYMVVVGGTRVYHGKEFDDDKTKIQNIETIRGLLARYHAFIANHNALELKYAKEHNVEPDLL